MTRSLSTVGVLLLVFVSSSRPARAAEQSIAPFDQVKTGMVVSIVDDAGREVHGRVESISDQVIRVGRRGRSEAVSVPTIVRIEKPDTLGNGALTGFTVGATVGMIMLIANGATHEPWIIAWATLANGAVYSGIGTAIDAMIKGKRTLYERGRERQTHVTPLVGPGVGGAAVRVSW